MSSPTTHRSRSGATKRGAPPGSAAPARRSASGGGRAGTRQAADLSRELTGLEAHALVTAGVDTAQAAALMASLQLIEPAQFFRTLGISERTFQRRAAGKSGTLDANASDRVLRLASVLALAARVLGSQLAAERWLTTPAIGLDRHVPLELLQSTEGTGMVRTLLNRMDYGVYA